jgi:hypothetical protein
MTGTGDGERLGVDLDDETVTVLRERAEVKGFDDVESYAAAVLEQVGQKLILRRKRSGDGADGGSEDERAAVRDRLRDLGYVD